MQLSIWIFIFPLAVTTAAWRSWKDLASRRYEPSYHDYDNKAKDGCVVGECTKMWECPSNATMFKPTGACAYLMKGTWVCCWHNNDNTRTHTPKSSWDYDSNIVTTSNHWRATTKETGHIPKTRKPTITEDTLDNWRTSYSHGKTSTKKMAKSN